ncbi:MAG TPA: glycosyl hydrolase [Ruminococcus sp.]|nr:glycosyl hydrolase [Ruminococcus sp.]
MTENIINGYQQCRKAADMYIEKMILPSDPLRPLWNRENFIFNKPARWNYIDSCMVMASLKLYGNSGDRRLLDFAVRFTDKYLRPDGSIPTMNADDFNLDNLCGGRNLIKLWQETGEERFRLGYTRLYTEQVLRQPRLECGSFWHKAVYPGQLWLDGAFMALPFVAEYGLLTGDRTAVSDVLRQLGNIRTIMRDRDNGLYYHGYDERRSQCWADSGTGLSPEFWLRSIGWLCAGLADIAELLPDSQLCREMLTDLLDSLGRYRQDDGMLLQLPAHPETEGNYPETSGTLLYAYAALKAANLGICDTVNEGTESLVTTVRKYTDLSGEVPVMKNICLMGGLGGEQERDGSPEYYLSERVVENDAKGVAPFLMAFAELERNELCLNNKFLP